MAPTIARTVAPVNSGGSNLNTLTTASFSPAANEVLVFVGQTEAGDRTFGTISNTGTALTWTSRVLATTGSSTRAVVQIWTAKVGATAPGAISVSVTATGSNGFRVLSGSGWSNAALAATPATHSVVGPGTCTDTITTVAANSVVIGAIADWNATPGTAVYQSSATEISNVFNGSYVGTYVAWQPATTAGSQTYGMTSPSPQIPTLASIEIQDAGGGGGGGGTISHVGTAATKISGTGTGTAITSTLPSGIASGDVLILEVGDGLDPTSITDPSGWTFLRRIADPGTAPAEAAISIWWKVAGSSETAPSLTASVATRWHSIIRAFRGVDTSSPFLAENAVAETASTTAHSAPALTNTDAGAWGLFALCSRQVATPYTATPGAGLTERVDQDTGNTGTTNTMYQAADTNGAVATGSVTYSATASGASTIAVMWAALLRPAGSGPTSITASDSAAGTESAAVLRASAATDSAAGTESAAVLRASTFTDSAAGTESAAVLRASAATDSAAVSEALSVTAIEYKTFTDSATGTEATPTIFDAFFASASDSAAGTEVVGLSSATAATDSAAGSEALGIVRSSAVTDSATGADAMAVQQGFVLADSGAGTETVGISSTTAATDSASGTEVLDVARASAVADTAAGTDSITLLRASGFTDEAVGTEGVPVVLRSTAGLTDSATGTEAIAILRISAVTDSAVGTEAPPGAGPFVTDSATLTDDFQLVIIPFTQVLPLKLGVIYDLVVVARFPQQSGPPQFFEIDPIEWKSLTITNTLSEAQDLSATAQLSSITEPVVQRLRDLDTLATELRLYRNGKIVFAGPLVGWQTSGETLTVKAQGLLSYLKMMVIASDQKFVNADQFTIVKSMVDQWQTGTYGNFGIDTSVVPTSGVVRTGDYLRDELHNVYTRVTDLGKLANGFDIEIDPATRQLQLWNPMKGVDRSSGEDALVFDSRNVTSSDVVCSVMVGDLATESYATSKSAGADSTLFSMQVNTELRAKYGRVAYTQTYSDVSQQSILDGYAQGLLDARNDAFLIPGPKVRVTPDADLPDYAEGDTVAYELGGRLSVSGSFRIRKRVINVGSDGRENVDLEFV